MPRWVGMVGFVSYDETSPSVWEEQITERKYTGDLIRKRIINRDPSSINPQLNVSNQVSIIADPFALKNFSSIRYLTFMGEKWNANEIEFERPRIIISLGGKYSEK